MKCPKCGREAWGAYPVKRTVRLASPPWKKTYTYREYKHYAGSKKSITLKALNEILHATPEHFPHKFGDVYGWALHVEIQAKERAGSKVIHHYDKV